MARPQPVLKYLCHRPFRTRRPWSENGSWRTVGLSAIYHGRFSARIAALTSEEMNFKAHFGRKGHLKSDEGIRDGDLPGEFSSILSRGDSFEVPRARDPLTEMRDYNALQVLE